MAARPADRDPQPSCPWRWAEVDWAPLVRRLLVFTHRKLRQRVWRGFRGGPLPDGTEAEDLVQDAICKTLLGNRAFNPQRTSLFLHFASVIASDINHLAMSYSNRNSIRCNEQVYEDRAVPEPDCQADHNDSLCQLLEALGDCDDQIRKVVQAIVRYDEICPRYIADVTGLDVKAVYNIKKKLRRRLQIIRGVPIAQEVVIYPKERMRQPVASAVLAMVAESKHGDQSYD
jgi:DNA-directed RNA polymerase specialized sigma24 family protein